MRLRNASVVDIIRSSQKDEQFTDVFKNNIFEIVRLSGKNKLRKLTNAVHPLVVLLYYYLTSFSKLQTLGEEYTGILRFIKNNKNIPGNRRDVVWLLLFIGGDELYNKALRHFEKKLKQNKALEPEARATLIRCVQFLINNKELLLRINQTLFYLNGDYYYISNRLTKIQYVFLRNWMAIDNSSKAINWLGKASFFYLIFTIFSNLYDVCNSEESGETDVKHSTKVSQTSDCFICAETLSNSTVLPCGHVYCWDCTFNSMRYGGKCPICRENIHSNRIILLQNY